MNPAFARSFPESKSLRSHVKSWIFAGLHTDLNQVVRIYTVVSIQPTKVFARRIPLRCLALSGRDCGRREWLALGEVDGVGVTVRSIYDPSDDRIVGNLRGVGSSEAVIDGYRVGYYFRALLEIRHTTTATEDPD